MGTEKTAIEYSDLLKWILGAALIGGGARAGLGLSRQLAPPKSVSKGDLSTDEVTVPVDLTPAQMKAYRSKVKQQGLDKNGSEKTAGPWDNTLYTLGAMGGGTLGWYVASKILQKIRKRRLDSELQKVRGELNQLTGLSAEEDLATDEMAPKQADEQAKVAAFNDWIEGVAHKWAEARDEVDEQLPAIIGMAEKTAGVKLANPALAAMARRNLPLLAGAGGLGALGMGSMLPGARHAIGGLGDAASGIFGGAAKSAIKPVGYTLASILGPVAALFGVMSLVQGYQSARRGSKKRKELKEFRRHVRRGEAIEDPYVRLEARRGKKRDKAEPGATDLDMNSKYSEALEKVALDQYIPAMDSHMQAVGLHQNMQNQAMQDQLNQHGILHLLGLLGGKAKEEEPAKEAALSRIQLGSMLSGRGDQLQRIDAPPEPGNIPPPDQGTDAAIAQTPGGMNAIQQLQPQQPAAPGQTPPGPPPPNQAPVQQPNAGGQAGATAYMNPKLNPAPAPAQQGAGLPSM